jgi:DNA-directed RNA polymerase sigma subunit (sigma70/sigma32)
MTSWASSREAALKPETGRISGSALSAVTLVVLPIGGTAVSGAFDDGRCEQKRRTTIMTGVAALSTITAGSGLARYFEEIRRLPMLEPDEEFMLARRWRERSDRDAEHRLVTSHLRLVAKIAAGYRGYGLPAAEIIAEGNLGLMQAVRRFEPERGFRLATYAIWWIRASIQEYVLRS